MNLLYLKMGPMRFRGGGGGGGGGGGDGGDSGDSGDSGDTGDTGDVGNVSDMGNLGEVSVSADAISDEGDAGLGATLADMAANGNPAANTNGIAGQLGVENPTLAAIVNQGLGMIANMAVPGIGGVGIGMANAAINGNPASAAAAIGNAVASAAGIPGGIGSAIGNAIGNMSGVPAASVPGDPTGGGSGVGDRGGWTASPTATPGASTLSGGLGLPGAPGAGTLQGIRSSNPLALIDQPKVAGDPDDFSGAGYAIPEVVKALRKAVDKPEFAWN